MLDAPGWYGKIASQGDFVQRRLGPAWVARLDPWLAGVMAEAPRTWGPGWLERYLTAPLLRFAFAPGVTDEGWWFGVLMPSCDQVGRYFPLVVAQARPGPPLDRIGLDHLELWWDRTAEAMVRTLHEDARLERFEDELAALPPWPLTRAAPAAEPPPDDWMPWPDGAALGHRVGQLAARVLLSRWQGRSLWWRQGQSGHGGGLYTAPGLPEPAALLRLLSA